MARKKTSDKRCAVCGKTIALGERVYRITLSKNAESGWVDQSLWGIAHPSCFASAIESPDAVMTVLRKQANG